MPIRSRPPTRYRGLLVAIFLFLVLDLGVLLFNVYSSRQIEAATGRINLAGELRMYSQQLTKALLTLDQETRAGLPNQTSLAQLSEASQAFNASLAQLKLAAAEATLPASLVDDADSDRVRAGLLSRLEKHWRPLDELVVPLLARADVDAEAAGAAATTAVARNVRLMQLADDLTRHLEATALERTQAMRKIQLAAIVLATLNFAFIVFKFVRSLRRSDQLAEEARRETQQILSTLREGLFLLGPDWRVGRQRSASLASLLGREIGPGEDFRMALHALFKPADAEAAEQFIALLFSRRVKPALLGQLNPLHEVEVRAPHGERAGARHLSFEFTPVRRDGQVESLLITVFDVTQKVRLEHQLAGANERARSDVELLLGVLDHEPATVRAFLAAGRDKLQAINAELEAVKADSGAYRLLVTGIASAVHGIKGEAAALGLGTVERQAHAFEDLLHGLRRRQELTGEALIPVAVEVNALAEQIARVEAIVERVARYGRPDTEATPRCLLAPILRQAERLAFTVAGELDKAVRVEIAAPELPQAPPALTRLLQATLPQFIRNAVVHGIEPAAERSAAGKPDAGLIRVEVTQGEDGGLLVAIEDDGRGLSPAALRRRLVERGDKTPLEAAEMSDQDVVERIFEAGFSTLDAGGRHAGRGDGLAFVRRQAAELGARIRVASQPKRFTRFLLQFGSAS